MALLSSVKVPYIPECVLEFIFIVGKFLKKNSWENIENFSSNSIDLEKCIKFTWNECKSTKLLCNEELFLIFKKSIKEMWEKK